MMTVKEVSKLSGLTIRTLQYYDKIGLLSPAEYSEAGYRLYNEENLRELRQIMLFREMEFSLKEIKAIMKSDYDKNEALEEQINLLILKKEHIEGIIEFATRLKNREDIDMGFDIFDNSKIENYAKEAKEKWGATLEYQEFEEKSKGKSKLDKEKMAKELMDVFAKFGLLRNEGPASQQVQAHVKILQEYITKHYYKCTDEILSSLGMMYVHDPEFRHNIDEAGGEGTASLVAEAIVIYCNGRK